MFRALFVDIDGTITDARRRAEFEAVELLRKLGEHLTVVITSGNVLPVAFGIRQFIGLNGPVIAENGGVVLYNDEVEVLATIDEVERFYIEAKKHINMERIFTDRWRLTEIALKPDADYEKLLELSRRFSVRIERTGFAVHIMPENVSKARAMQHICRKLGVKVEECIAVGDGDNDAEMLEIAGFSGAPANASPLAKQKAKYVARNSYGKGFAEIMEMAGLNV
ncbi:MAG: phosphoglycolate phosphatase [Thermoplasmata archaeon]|nr:phosphoglycolate phosphatase [Thermoplasmata archaeon]